MIANAEYYIYGQLAFLFWIFPFLAIAMAWWWEMPWGKLHVKWQ